MNDAINELVERLRDPGYDHANWRQEAAALIEELSTQVETAKALLKTHRKELISVRAADIIETLASENERLREERDHLKKTFTPFAFYDERAARAALKEKP